MTDDRRVPFPPLATLPMRTSDVHRIEFRHGKGASPILARMAEDPDSRRVVCLCQHVVRAEIEQIVEDGADSIDGVCQPTGLGAGACGGVRCTYTCAQIIVDAHGGGADRARELVGQFHASPRVTARALSLDADAAATSLLAQLEQLRLLKIPPK